MKSKKQLYSIVAIIIILIVGMFFLGKKYEAYQSDSVFSMNDTGLSIYNLKRDALGKGNIDAYQNLSTEYLDYSTEEFLPIALEMANRHNYPTAYFDVYFTLTRMEHLYEDTDSLSKWENWNSKMRRLALEYLLSGAKLNHEQSIETLKDYYLTNKRLNAILLLHPDLVEQYSKTLEKIMTNK